MHQLKCSTFFISQPFRTEQRPIVVVLRPRPRLRPAARIRRIVDFLDRLTSAIVLVAVTAVDPRIATALAPRRIIISFATRALPLNNTIDISILSDAGQHRIVCITDVIVLAPAPGHFLLLRRSLNIQNDVLYQRRRQIGELALKNFVHDLVEQTVLRLRLHHVAARLAQLTHDAVDVDVLGHRQVLQDAVDANERPAPTAASAAMSHQRNGASAVGSRVFDNLESCANREFTEF